MKFDVSIKLEPNCYPITGLNNAVEADSPFEAYEKCMKFHKYSHDLVTEFSVVLHQCYPDLD